MLVFIIVFGKIRIHPGGYGLWEPKMLSRHLGFNAETADS